MVLGPALSEAAGLPSWQVLLDRLHAELALAQPIVQFDSHTELQKAAVRAHSAYAFADRLHVHAAHCDATGRQVLLDMYGGKEPLGKTVAECLRSDFFGLQQALIASLPVKSVVSTNVDQGFENACDAVEYHRKQHRPYSPQRLSVLPYKPRFNHERSILKLHGCTSVPAEMVLPSEDYDAYDSSTAITGKHAGLGAIIQATLMTHELVFVGFGPKDHGFLRILDSVRKAFSHSDHVPNKLGISLQLSEPAESGPLPNGTQTDTTRAIAQLQPWPVYMRLGERPISLAESVRQLEIFLDCLAASSCSSSAFLFDERFAAALTVGERELQSALLRLYATSTPAMREAVAWRDVKLMFAGLGGDPAYSPLLTRAVQQSQADAQELSSEKATVLPSPVRILTSALFSRGGTGSAAN